MMGGRIHAALQHVPLYSVWELGTSDVASRATMEHDGKALKRSCQMRIMKGEAQSEGKKANDGIRYVKWDNKTYRGPASGLSSLDVKKTGQSEG